MKKPEFLAPLSFADVQAACDRIHPWIINTPVVFSAELSQALGVHLWLKCEHLQTTGSFKFRGALNAILSLSEDQRQAGIAAHSSGNHGIALATIARQLQIPCTIVVPRTAPLTKRQKLEQSGAKIVLCAPDLAAREACLNCIQRATGATEIHSSHHANIIAGAGTVALEFLAAVPDLEVLIAPVGGGGLLSGTGLVAQQTVNPAVEVFGAEPAGADDARCSLQAGYIIRKPARTIADGLRSALGSLTFGIIRQSVRDILLVEDTVILQAMHWIEAALGFIVEPSAAITLAAIAVYPSLFYGRNVGVILSGGNVDAGLIST
jgi:threonine dehydratase